MGKLFILVFTLFTFSATAAEFKLDDLTEDDLKNVVRELSGNFAHTTVSGATPLSNEGYGFEVGLLLGAGKTPKLNDLAHKADPNVDLDKLPNAGIIGLITIPYAITFESVLTPKVGNKDFKYQSLSLAVKWTMSKVFPAELPVDIAIKAHTQKTKLEGQTTVDGVASTITFDDKITGFDVVISKELGVFEPYASIGVMRATGDLSATAGAIFNPAFTGGKSASESSQSTQLTLGSEFKFGLFKMGLEVSKLYDMTRAAAKFAFYF